MNLNKLYLQYLFLTCHWGDSHNFCVCESEYYICIVKKKPQIFMLMFHLYFDTALHTHRFCESVLTHVCQKRWCEMQRVLKGGN